MISSGLVRYHDDLDPLLVDIDTVVQHPRNYNNGDVDRIAESIEVNGMYRPIYVQKGTGVIIAGNHTWVACKQLGADRIPVVWLDVDEAAMKRIMVGDNWIASLALPDQGLLLELLREIDEDTGLVGTGVVDNDLDRLQKALDNAAVYTEPPPPIGYQCPHCGHVWHGDPRPGGTMSGVQKL